MPRKSKIRWRDADIKELEKDIKNFNAKINRLKRERPEMVQYLPETKKKKDIMKDIQTRSEFNREMNSLKRFTKRGAEKPISSTRGAKATQWEVSEFKRKQGIENARRTKERNKIGQKPVTSRGVDTGVKRAEMGSVRENELRPSKKKFDNLSQKEWELAKKSIDKQVGSNYQDEKKQKMKDNYLKGLIEAGYPEDLISLIKQVPIDTFIETTYTDQEASFDFIYDPVELNAKAEALRAVWEHVING